MLAKLQWAIARKVVHDSDSELDPVEQDQERLCVLHIIVFLTLYPPTLQVSSQAVSSKPTETKAKALTQRTSKLPPTQVFRNITNEQVSLQTCLVDQYDSCKPLPAEC
jgi:hypothetical protein